MIKIVAPFIFSGLLITTVYAGETSNYSRYQQEELLGVLDHSTTAVSYEPIYEGYDFKSIGAPDISYETMPSFLPVNNQRVEQQCRILNQLGSACFQKQQVLREGVVGQIKYLQRHSEYAHFVQQGVDVGGQQLMTTAKSLLAWLDHSQSLTEQFDLVPLSASEVKFTGYYTPEIIASHVYTPRFCFPVYRKPSTHQLKLSRDEVTKGALNGQGLEIAWVDDPIALFYIHMQGSGILKFSGGGRKVLKFSASNTYNFKSIASYMYKQGYLNGDLSRRAITHWLSENPSKLNEVLAANPRYIYFNLSDSMPLTASGLPLIAGHTVAVDTKFIPFGSVLLTEIPQFDGEGKAVGYEWRMLLPQDRGNAIVGQARLDLYTGVGELAKRQANLITGVRRTFLLLKKQLPM